MLSRPNERDKCVPSTIFKYIWSYTYMYICICIRCMAWTIKALNGDFVLRYDGFWAVGAGVGFGLAGWEVLAFGSFGGLGV